MSAVAKSQEIDCTFGGYHCTVDRLVGNLVPDMVIMTSEGATLAYLEVKPNWTLQYKMGPAVRARGPQDELRRILGNLSLFLSMYTFSVV